MKNPIAAFRILIIEDNIGDFVLITNYLIEQYSQPVIVHAKTFNEAKSKIETLPPFNVILLYLSQPNATGKILITNMVKLAGPTPIIILTGYVNKTFSIETLSLGISDYLLKDELTSDQLYKSIAYSIDRSRINNELKESEENYRKLFDLSPIPMWVFNWETLRFLNVNKAAIEEYGYTKEEFLSMTLQDLHPAHTKATLNVKALVEESLKIQNPFKGIYCHSKKNGELIDVEITRNLYSLESKTLLVLAKNITVSVYQENILALEKQVYELNATSGISFAEVLETLTKNIEQILPFSSCAILKKQENGTGSFLSNGNFPEAFLLAFDGFKIGLQETSCGKAMCTGQNIFIHDISTDPLWNTYKEVINTFGYKASWSVPIKKRDGTVIGSIAAYFKTINSPLLHQINLLERAASLLGILIENRSAVEDIKTWNERYNMVAKVTNDVIWDWNLATNQVFWSKNLKTIFGYDVITDNTSTAWWSSKIHLEDVKRVEEKLTYHIKNNIVMWQDEYRFLCNDGTYKYIFDRGFLVLDENNIAVKLIGSMQDISKQKEEQHHLKLLESVITNTSDAVVITGINYLDTKEHKIIYTNEAFTKMTGFTKEEIIAKSPKLLQGSKTNHTELKRLEISMKKWEPCEIEVINYKKNGEEFWNNIAISPVADTMGIYTHWIAIQRDITTRKKKDQEITRAIISTQEYERFQIGGELHDNVNQILAGVLLNLGMAKSKPLTEQSEWIDQSVTYIHLAISEIRKLSHKLAPVSFDENSLKDTFSKLLKSINIDNRFKIQLSVVGVNDISIDGNIQMNLYRILQEQLNNIMKYSMATKIETTLTLVNGAINLRIYDNGIGFDTNLKKNKNGIGFNNIKKRTELFSGSFSLKSSIGKGCEIIVEIPIAVA